MDTRIANPIAFRPNNLQTSNLDRAAASRTTQLGAGELLPAGTSVSEEIKTVFDRNANLDGELMTLLTRSCSNPELRQAGNFNRALERTLDKLKKSAKGSAQRASQVLQELSNDQELLANYRATLL